MTTALPSKSCLCPAGHDHAALVFDHRAPAWLALEFAGECVQEAEVVDGVAYEYERTELRHCACKSTLGVTLSADGRRIA